MSNLNTSHNVEAKAQLIENLQNSEKLKALLDSYVDQIQDLEAAIHPIHAARNIDTMTGDRPDGLGEIVGVPRDGRLDEAYRLRIRAELAILKSNGIEVNLINILQLLLGMSTADILFDEYYPKTVYMRVRNYDATSDDMQSTHDLLTRAAPVGTDIHLIFGTTGDDEANTFRFSDTSGTPELTSDKGFGSGTLNGVTN